VDTGVWSTRPPREKAQWHRAEDFERSGRENRLDFTMGTRCAHSGFAHSLPGTRLYLKPASKIVKEKKYGWLQHILYYRRGRRCAIYSRLSRPALVRGLKDTQVERKIRVGTK
jgi:hypothetical protein